MTKHEPTDFIAQFLVIKHQVTDPIRELRALPFPLKMAEFFNLTIWGCFAYCLNRIGGRPQFMRRHMSNYTRLTSSICSIARCSS